MAKRIADSVRGVAVDQLASSRLGNFELTGPDFLQRDADRTFDEVMLINDIATSQSGFLDQSCMRDLARMQAKVSSAIKQ